MIAVEKGKSYQSERGKDNSICLITIIKNNSSKKKNNLSGGSKLAVASRL